MKPTINGLDVDDSRCVKERLEKTMLTGPESFDDVPNLLWCCHTHSRHGNGDSKTVV